jgi:hypothetical protein
MSKELTKKHIFGFVALGIIITILVLGGIIWGVVYSERLSLTFTVNGTGEKLDGVLYQNDIKLGNINNGKINLVWQEFYPGELRFDLNGNTDSSFYFELAQEDISAGRQDFHIEEYQINDLSLSVSDYNLDEESSNIIEGINDKRAEDNLPLLKEDIRLEKIARELASEVIQDKIDGNDIDGTIISDKMKENNILFYGSENYWHDYTVDSSMSLSEEFIEDILEEKYWSERFLSEYITNIAIVTECGDNKRCFTLAILSQNGVFYDTVELKKDYFMSHDAYYAIELNGVNLDYGADVTYYFNSTKSASVYLLNSSEDYDKLLDRKNVKKIFSMKSAQFNKTIFINPGNTLVVEADSRAIIYDIKMMEDY